ncbi:hypothetical protein [Puia dinghuensis]|uniref:hypothetical protein n=1 Tax=Puia dinghuensis TaxID=1792502 RepID=UPI001667CC5B|nr:hypothetical protein [Puia dinghuensis]
MLRVSCLMVLVRPIVVMLRVDYRDARVDAMNDAPCDDDALRDGDEQAGDPYDYDPAPWQNLSYR